MYNSTMNTYEMKREIINFTKKISKGVNKPTMDFMCDIEYGLAKSGSCLISNIARVLDEEIKLKNVIERICLNLSKTSDNDKEIIWNNYLKEIKSVIDINDSVVLFDDSDINKEYSKKLEDLDKVMDGSSLDKRIVNGYHVCEATVLSKESKQPISIYSQIYSCNSDSFKSKNIYTLESIKAAERLIGEKFTGVFDRGYDDNKIFNYMSDNNHKFVVRLDDERTLLFKGKKRSVEEVSKSRKGKIAYKALFNNNEKIELMLTHTKAVLPNNKREYTLVLVYGLKENHPMKLLTNIDIKDKKEVIKVVNLYLSRWRIEEYFRGKKQEYDFENMRVRTLRSMNNLNMMLTIHLGHMAILAENMDNRLLTIKIIYASNSLKSKSIVWLSQISRGIKNILSFAHQGIKEWKRKEVREKYKQLSLNLSL